jgi:hypothetical protein
MPVCKFKWELEIPALILIGNDVGGSGRGLITRHAVPGVRFEGGSPECEAKRQGSAEFL